MNGRVYDPLIGQFLSPDNYIQDPTFTQNYNRYTYCLNNPLKYVDPSGYVKLKTWDDFWSVVDDLWRQGGGSWDSRTDNIPSGGGQGGGYGVPSGTGFQGPGQPYMLPEVTVTAKAPEKKTPTTPIVDNNDPFLGIIASRGGGEEPGFGESLIPIWGSGRSAISSFQNENYWASIGYGVLAVTDMFLVKSALTAVAKGTITLAAKYCLREAVVNPTLTAREAAAAIRNPSLEAMMNGKGIDRAFRAAASNNLILRPAESIGILQINPMNRGADMVGRGILQGTWWDVTTSGSWGTHVSRYGLGGIKLIYP
jgi:hypothetical protein